MTSSLKVSGGEDKGGYAPGLFPGKTQLPAVWVRLLEGGTGWVVVHEPFQPKAARDPEGFKRSQPQLQTPMITSAHLNSLMFSWRQFKRDCTCLFLDAVSLTLRVHRNQVNKTQDLPAQQLCC